MKKLMMALVAVAFGCAAHAATVNWTTTTIQQISDKNGTQGGAPITSALGYTAILTIIGEGGYEVESQGIWGTGKIASTPVTSDYLLNSTATDTKQYHYTLVISGPVSNSTRNYADAIGKTATLTYEGTVTMNGQGNTSLEIKPTGATWSYASVPEPTSGLLLLLGVAGMALRRRRA